MADNLGYTDVGVYGSEIATPNIDQLAQKGIQFTNFYTSAMDAQNRAMLLSGVALNQVENAESVKTNVKNIAQLLQATGYRTMMSGKWNLGKETTQLPIAHGFEYSFSVSEEVSGHLGDKRYLPAIYREGIDIQEISQDFYSTQYFSRKLQSFISQGRKKEQRKPFFAYLAYSAPNDPLQAPRYRIEDQKGKYDVGYQKIYEQRRAKQQALGLIGKEMDALKIPDWEALSPELQAYEARKMEIYAAMIQDVDKEIGKLIDYLKVAKAYDNTIIFFLSDNGIVEKEWNPSLATIDNSLENMGQGNSLVALGQGWTRMKRDNIDQRPSMPTIEIPLNAPLLIHSPLLGNASSRLETVKTVLDIAPTILDFAEVLHPSESYFDATIPMDGVSFRTELLSVQN